MAGRVTPFARPRAAPTDWLRRAASGSGSVRVSLVMANGIIHHVADEEAVHLLRFAHEALRSIGTLVTSDGCFEEGQGAVAPFLQKGDRSTFVRTREAHKRLFARVLRGSTAVVRRDTTRLPCSLIAFQSRKRERRA